MGVRIGSDRLGGVAVKDLKLRSVPRYPLRKVRQVTAVQEIRLTRRWRVAGPWFQDMHQPQRNLEFVRPLGRGSDCGGRATVPGEGHLYVDRHVARRVRPGDIEEMALGESSLILERGPVEQRERRSAQLVPPGRG